VDLENRVFDVGWTMGDPGLTLDVDLPEACKERRQDSAQKAAEIGLCRTILYSRQDQKRKSQPVAV